MSVALLTGGSDKPYALGLASALAAEGIALDFIGSDELDCADVHAIPGLTFLNLRGDQREDVPLRGKIARIVLYYARLLRYVATADIDLLHILWNNKFELFDRTALMFFYRLAGKRVVLTAHNINVAARDGRDSWINRLSLRMQYLLCGHVFVHTERMRRELIDVFGVAGDRITVIPFGINSTIPSSDLTASAARRHLGLEPEDRTVLFFGQIAPYKGLQHLIAAVRILHATGDDVRLIVAGKIKRGSERYWAEIERDIEMGGISQLVIRRIQFIPDEEVELYFKSADVVAIPYVSIYQSGVPFLAFSFGVPVIATDVGSLREDVVSETGLLCRPSDPEDLALAIQEFYRSDFRCDVDRRRKRIQRFASERHSWRTVAARTSGVYSRLLNSGPGRVTRPRTRVR